MLEPVEPGAHVVGRCVDLDGADAVRAVDEVVPGGEGTVEVALAKADAAEVGEDDRAASAAVEAVDVEGEAEVFFGLYRDRRGGRRSCRIHGPIGRGSSGLPRTRRPLLLAADGGLGEGEMVGGRLAVAVLGRGVGEGGFVVGDGPGVDSCLQELQPGKTDAAG
ncbi:hypothetical protein [Streptomyces morookaense]|uniref:Uncharacterized protein n=1 Tax=Streptomyces morookaense TaxID=1970 RepID=A0A7Y7E7C1_STRMO|nr:hypothetical protein [Streptomyces morookaense]NVK78795.1 hypothetical protein [Streptomyces morookaense]